MPNPILYHCRDARSFRALWMLEEIGIDYDLRLLPFPPRFRQPDYLAENPLGTIPLLVDGKIESIIVMALSLEAKPGSTDAIYAIEPKLRDTFLQILFDHANSGGFRGSFTESTALARLRVQLLDAAGKIMPGGVITEVLITDIGRQDS